MSFEWEALWKAIATDTRVCCSRSWSSNVKDLTAIQTELSTFRDSDQAFVKLTASENRARNLHLHEYGRDWFTKESRVLTDFYQSLWSNKWKHSNDASLLLFPTLLDSFWSMTLVFSISLWSNIWHFQFNAQLPVPLTLLVQHHGELLVIRDFELYYYFADICIFFPQIIFDIFPLGFGCLALGKGRHLFLILYFVLNLFVPTGNSFFRFSRARIPFVYGGVILLRNNKSRLIVLSLLSVDTRCE